MNEVRHLPVAEQYPSKTATVSALASNLISGISGGFLLFAAEVVGKGLNLANGRVRNPPVFQLPQPGRFKAGRSANIG